jgi:hypothetical protein
MRMVYLRGVLPLFSPLGISPNPGDESGDN